MWDNNIMPEPWVRISASSRRQAMDFSLVLTSQGIDAVLDHLPENDQWALLVSPQDEASATEAIRLYLVENKHWRWRRRILAGGLLFDWTSVLWVILLVCFYIAAVENPAMREIGVMQKEAVVRGEVWRLFTAIWLHANLAHLASNAALGSLLLGLAMGRFGAGLGLLAAYASGVGGNLAVCLLAFGHGSLGASGMVMGCLGLLAAGTLAVPGWTTRHSAPNRKSPGLLYATRGVLAGILLFVLVGLNPETDFRAHLGGFVTGGIAGAILTFRKAPGQRQVPGLVAAVVFALLVILPWFFAFHAAS